jgi:zinc transporter ZupT
MIDLREIVIVSLLGLLTTSSSMVGAALGLYVPLSKRVLACVLAFAAGALISGIPEAAASASMLKRAGYSPFKVFALWSAVLVAGIVAAAAGKIFVGSGSHVAIFSQALAGGAVLAVVAHAMIPESIHEGGSLVVLPTVAGFLFALWLALGQSFV